MGPVSASRFLQRALNLSTDAALATDGIVGPASIRALEAFLKRRGAEGERRLLALLNAFQGARYADLAAGPLRQPRLYIRLARADHGRGGMTVLCFTAAKDARQPHWSGTAVCIGCRHEWKRSLQWAHTRALNVPPAPSRKASSNGRLAPLMAMQNFAAIADARR
ncbi:putative peptidoglycan-binding domain-containing protein [Sphingomonas sp. MMS24-JH45]